MVEKFRARLLEVKITHEPPLWRWQVLAGDSELSSDVENAQVKASFEGYNAMFLLLAAGWKA
jgi:hypothetical protein